MMGKHRDLKRDFGLAGNKQCGKLSTNGRQTVDVAQLDWDEGLANSGVISVTA
jgi:hypothetical protein